MRLRLSLTLLTTLAAPLGLAQTFTNVFTEGHTDGLAVGRNAADAHKFDFFTKHDNETTGDEEEFDPASTLLVATKRTIIPRPAGSGFDFIGVAAGQSFSWLPQEQYGDPVLDLGTAAEDLTGSQFGAWDPDGAGPRASAKWVKFTLTGLTSLGGGVAPGQFSSWSGTNNGTETPAVSQVNVATSDGISAADAITIGVGGHVHYNWGFSAPGYYVTTWVAESRLADGSTILSDPTRVTFYAEPVPEPATLAVLGLGAFGLLRRRKRA